MSMLRNPEDLRWQERGVAVKVGRVRTWMVLNAGLVNLALFAGQ